MSVSASQVRFRYSKLNSRASSTANAGLNVTLEDLGLVFASIHTDSLRNLGARINRVYGLNKNTRFQTFR